MDIAKYLITGMSPQLIVSDMERSIQFYTSKLNFKVSFTYEDFYCGIHNGDYTVHLKLGHPLTTDSSYQQNNEHLDIYFSVEGIENLYNSVLDKTLEIIQPLRDMPYGREFYIADPDGYIIGFLEEV